MDYSTLHTYEEVTNAHFNLVNKLQGLRDKLALSDSDARIVLVSGMQLMIAGFSMGLHSFWYNRDIAEMDRALGDASGWPFEKKRFHVETAWRLGLVTLFMFKVDALITRLLVGLGDTPQNGFYKNAKSLLERLAIVDKTTKLGTLMIPAAIRNSLHNNGMHKGPPSSQVLYGMTFEFEDGKACLCASTKHILAALHACMDTVEEILFCSDVIAIPDGIADPYVAAGAPGWYG